MELHRIVILFRLRAFRGNSKSQGRSQTESLRTEIQSYAVNMRKIVFKFLNFRVTKKNLMWFFTAWGPFTHSWLQPCRRAFINQPTNKNDFTAKLICFWKPLPLQTSLNGGCVQYFSSSICFPSVAGISHICC